MNELWVVALLVLGIPLLGGPVRAAGDRATPDAQPDARLDRPVSITISYSPLDEFCGKLADMAGVAISVDPAIRDNKVIARVEERPLRDVMGQVAVLFDFEWTQSADDRPAYRLTQSEARAPLGPSMRERFFAEKLARADELFGNALKAAVMSVDERRELAKTDPEAVALAVTEPVVCQALATLDAAKLGAFLKRAEVRVPVKALPAETRAYLKQSILNAYKEREEDINEADWLWNEAVIWMRRVDLRFPWGAHWSTEIPSAKVKGEVERTGMDDFRPVVSWGALTRTIERGPGWQPTMRGAPTPEMVESLIRDYGIDVAARAREQAASRLPEWAGAAPGAPGPQPSGTLVALGLKPQDFYHVKPEAPLLLAIADKLDLDLIADCYWTGSMYRAVSFERPAYPFAADARQTEISVDANPEYTLSQVSGPRMWRWTPDGAFFRIRNALWFVDDAEEAPASALREWMRRTNREAHVTIDDYLALVNALTEFQARNLGLTYYEGRLYREGLNGQARWYEDDLESRALSQASQLAPYSEHPAVKLYSLLSPELKVRAETNGLLVGSELPEDVRPLAHRIAEVQSEVGNLRVSADEVPAIANGARFWTSWDASFNPDSVTGFCPSPVLRIALLSAENPGRNAMLNGKYVVWQGGVSERLGGEGASVTREGASAVAAPAAPQGQQYVRVQVSPKATAYVEFRGTQMRVAATAAGLANAKPVAASDVSGRFAVFPPVSLPVAASAKAGDTTLMASFMVAYPGAAAGNVAAPAHVYAGFKVERRDAKSVVYSYASASDSAVSSTARKAPVMVAADPSKLRLTLVASPSPGRIDAGLRVEAENLGQFDLRKQGGKLEARFRVLDSKGSVVKSDSAPLEIFGFT